MSSPEDILNKYKKPNHGTIHPINNIKDFLVHILEDIGFEHIEGPEIESEKFNFDMLNIKKTHPARQMHDTFYVNNKENVLRTHTSPVQIHAMLSNKPHYLLYQVARFTEKMMMQLICRCFIK